MHSRSCTSQETDRSGRLDACSLDAVRDAEPLGIHSVPILDRLVSAIEPQVHSVKIVLGEELRDTTDAASDATIPKLDAIRLGPMCQTQRNSLGVQVRKFKRTQKVFKRVGAIEKVLTQALMCQRVSKHTLVMFGFCETVRILMMLQKLDILDALYALV